MSVHKNVLNKHIWTAAMLQNRKKGNCASAWTVNQAQNTSLAGVRNQSLTTIVLTITVYRCCPAHPPPTPKSKKKWYWCLAWQRIILVPSQCSVPTIMYRLSFFQSPVVLSSGYRQLLIKILLQSCQCYMKTEREREGEGGRDGGWEGGRERERVCVWERESVCVCVCVCVCQQAATISNCDFHGTSSQP